MQISKKLQQNINHNGKQQLLPLHPHPPQHPRCTMRTNAVLVCIVLFFIVATSILQLPTVNYIKYLTNNNSSEIQTVQVKGDMVSPKPYVATTKKGTKNDSSSKADIIDDDSDEDDDTEERESKRDDDNRGNDESGKKVAKEVTADHHDQDNEEEPDDGDDDNEVRNIDSDNQEPQWEKNLSPKIVWLASYPNSGTSYTMTLVERASNFSTATNYGNEVTHPKYDSIPIYPNHEEGPFWEGTSEHAIQLNRVIRELPTTYVLTKTHCGGRCIKCPASEYMVNTTRQFIYGCQKTSYRKNSKMVTTEYGAPMSTIKKLLHLIRNPFHNVVARFHLERKNMISKDSSYEESFTYDASGFHNYCHYLDTTFHFEDKELLPSKLYKKYFHSESEAFIPCGAEFYKWVQWHNYVVQSSILLGLKSDRTEQIVIETDPVATSTAAIEQSSIPVHVIWYENYELDFNTTFISIMKFLQLPIATEQIRTFRSLPTYDDHFTPEQRTNIQALIQKIAIPSTWKLIKHYFD